ncbi:MAG TPA: CheR family methyltransferase [Burkholderiaceae bacterium]|nr:CheR family methyltransferase [Burkholderiaceae bacterium]
MDALLQEMQQRFGVDFRGYRRDHLWRRVLRRQDLEGLATTEELLRQVRRDRRALERLRRELMLQVTSLFRDPEFFRAVREHVVPWLRSYPQPRLWVAGCATGEEVYSYLVLLHEEGLLDRAIVHATDLDAGAVEQARGGHVEGVDLDRASERHLRAGGRRPLSTYLSGPVGSHRLPDEWLGKVVFSVHNLIHDASFHTFHLISCRNLLMYLDPPAEARAFGVLHDSLAPLGVLGLGNGESLWRFGRRDDYAPLHSVEPLYRRLR